MGLWEITEGWLMDPKSALVYGNWACGEQVWGWGETGYLAQILDEDRESIANTRFLDQCSLSLCNAVPVCSSPSLGT